MNEKIEHAKELIRDHGEDAALMCSFGKDSMVLLHLIRETLPSRKLSCHSYPLPVIYHRHPWFQFKNNFAIYVALTWALELHDYPPLACGVKAKENRIELVARYPLGLSAIDMPINTEQPIERRPFVCGLDWLLRPKISGLQWRWPNVFIGHKSSDIDPYDGPVPLKSDTAKVGEVNLVFPLRHWSDADVWEYIEANDVPYDKARYENRAELPDKWLNPDYLHACTACIDPRGNTDIGVRCPKSGAMVKNVGSRVLRLGEQIPEYIGKVAA